MGYGVYWNDTDQRWCGYGVRAYCDAPGCREEIDRGMGYVCGEPLNDQWGCGRYFCGKHLSHSRRPHGEGRYDNCNRCGLYKKPYKTISPEHPDWMRHVLLDKTWKEWRKNEPGFVAQYRKELAEIMDKKKNGKV